MKAITNIDGNFQIDGLDKEKTYTLYINYIGYKTQKIDGVQAKDADQVIALQPDDHQSYTLLKGTERSVYKALCPKIG